MQTALGSGWGQATPALLAVNSCSFTQQLSRSSWSSCWRRSRDRRGGGGTVCKRRRRWAPWRQHGGSEWRGCRVIVTSLRGRKRLSPRTLGGWEGGSRAESQAKHTHRKEKEKSEVPGVQGASGQCGGGWGGERSSFLAERAAGSAAPREPRAGPCAALRPADTTE